MAKRKDLSVEFDKDITSAFNRYGYKLEGYANLKQTQDGPEELIVKTLLNGRLHPIYFLGIPVVLLNNQIDYDKLLTLATQHKIEQKLGYALEFSKIAIEGYGKKDIPPGLINAIETLSSNKPKKWICLNDILTGPLYTETSKNELYESPLNKWKVIDRPDLES